MRAKGFTQVELLLALALAALIALVGFQLLWSAARDRKRQSENDRSARQLDVILSLMARDLRCAYLDSDDDHAAFAGRVAGSFSQVDFQRASPDAHTEKEEVGYAVRKNAQTGRWELFRREQNPADGALVSGGSETFLCEVEHVSLSFFDGEKWRETWGWDTARAVPTVGIRGLPLRVSVNLAVEVDGRLVERSRTVPVMVPLLNRSLGA